MTNKYLGGVHEYLLDAHDFYVIDSTTGRKFSGAPKQWAIDRVIAKL